MISETCVQEVDMYCDASEVCAMQGRAAGLAEGNRGPGVRHQLGQSTGRRRRRVKREWCRYPNLDLCFTGISNGSESVSTSSSVVNLGRELPCRGRR